MYLRLTTRPLDQTPFEAARARLGDDALRADVLAGGYRLMEAEPDGRPVVHLVGSGAVLPEVLAAASTLEDEGVAANVIDVTSLDRLYRGWRAGISSLTGGAPRHQLSKLIPVGQRHAPIVTVHDASPHAMGWLGSVFGAPLSALGVDAFGQSGSIGDLYRLHGLDPDTIVTAALVALDVAE